MHALIDLVGQAVVKVLVHLLHEFLVTQRCKIDVVVVGHRLEPRRYVNQSRNPDLQALENTS